MAVLAHFFEIAPKPSIPYTTFPSNGPSNDPSNVFIFCAHIGKLMIQKNFLSFDPKMEVIQNGKLYDSTN